MSELALALQTNKPVGTYAALAREAESAGFDVVTTFNDLWFQPALPALLEIAQATERVRVGPTCLNPFTVHPVEIAGQIAALDRASRGRAFLGLAASPRCPGKPSGPRHGHRPRCRLQRRALLAATRRAPALRARAA